MLALAQSMLFLNKTSQNSSKYESTAFERIIVKRIMKNENYSLEELGNFFKLGLKNQELENYSDAEKYYQCILKQIPSHTDTLHYLGLVKHKQGDNQNAIELINKAVSADKNNIEMIFNLAAIYEDNHQLQIACDTYQKVLLLQANHPLAHYHLGHIYKLLGNAKLHAQYTKKAYELSPRSTQIANAYATILMNQLDIGEAHTVLKNALDIEPNNESLLSNLGYCLYLIGDFPYAQRCFQKIPSYSQEHPNRADSKLLHLNYNIELSSEKLFREHVERGKAFQRFPITIPEKFGEKNQNRKLRIGYVSADFNFHSVAYFFEPIIQHHDITKFTIYCYNNNRDRVDSITEKIRNLCHQWKDIYDKNDKEVIQTIVDDQIDILVDLSGYTAGNRLGVFANRAAPIQITYLGYPNTTGLSNVDYRISDLYTDPIGKTDQFYSEKLLRLKNTFLCYAPRPTCPSVSPPPMRKNSFVTFGSFNNMAKINDEVVKLWSKLLTVIPNSKLLLKSKALVDNSVKVFTFSRFEKHGITKEQLILQGYAKDFRSHITSYSHMDISLDPFPYNGTATSFESLWMGVPVIALLGETHRSRVTAAILKKIGLEQLIANNYEEYIDIAKSLALDKNLISHLRSTMRNKITQCGFIDGKRFTQELEALYTKAWNDH